MIRLSLVGLLVMTSDTLSMEKPIAKRHGEYQLTLDGIRDLVKETLHSTLVDDESGRPPPEWKDEASPGDDPINGIACDDSSEKADISPTLIDDLIWFLTVYLPHYRLTAAEMKNTPQKYIDCNDFANRACEQLSKEDFPMLLISVWPERWDERMNRAYHWHEFAACKLRDNLFLIVDCKKSVLWKGTLEEYVQQRSSVNTKMEIIPIVGISKYAETQFDLGVGKLISQGKHATNDMQSYYRNFRNAGSDSAIAMQRIRSQTEKHRLDLSAHIR